MSDTKVKPKRRKPKVDRAAAQRQAWAVKEREVLRALPEPGRWVRVSDLQALLTEGEIIEAVDRLAKRQEVSLRGQSLCLTLAGRERRNAPSELRSQLGKTQRDALDSMLTLDTVSADDLAEQLGNDPATMRRVLRQLLDRGLIERASPRRFPGKSSGGGSSPGRYRLTEEGICELRLRLDRGLLPGVSGTAA